MAEAECIDASHEVVAALLAELCPPPPEEAPPLQSEDFGPEPPSARSRSGGILGAPAMALGATGSDRLSGPLPLPPPPERPQLLVLGEGDLDLDELPLLAEDLQKSPSALLATPVLDSAPIVLPLSTP